MAGTTLSAILNNLVDSNEQNEPEHIPLLKNETKEVEEEEEEEDVPFSEVEIDSDADVVPFQKLTINNVAALRSKLATIELRYNDMSFVQHNSITSDMTAESQIKDIYDDLEKDSVFTAQALEAVKLAGNIYKSKKMPFLPPNDFWSETIKPSKEMDQLKKKLDEQETAKKLKLEQELEKKSRSRKGKSLHVESKPEDAPPTTKRSNTEQSDSRSKKRVKGNKNDSNKKDSKDSEFQIALEEAAAIQAELTKLNTNKNKHKLSTKRETKNKKYGHGGMKRYLRKNDADSSADIYGFSSKSKKGRPGRSKRR